MGATLGDAVAALHRRYMIPQFRQTVLWLQMVRPDMVGATATSGRDTVRSQAVSYTDGSFGVGWQIVDSAGFTRLGYLRSIALQAAINDRAVTQEVTEAGLVVAESPVIYLSVDPGLSKGDVIVFGTVRYRVADRLHPYQVFGQTVLQRHALEKHEANSIIYQIPT